MIYESQFEQVDFQFGKEKKMIQERKKKDYK